MRTGIGIDFHRLEAGRRLVLGGVEIPFEQGLAGHSDADVLTHAVCDALLGAAGLGDIGQHFPDSDAAYRGVSSLTLLTTVGELLADRDLEIGNVDATVIAQAPKLAPYFAQMTTALGRALSLNPARINLKATTSEGLGFTGAGAGMAAWAVALLTRR